jgi:acetyltransferase-like isoleucine patch superfamily enzyme
MRRFIAVFSVLLPWPIRRRLLSWFLGYELHPTSRIGFSLVFPGKLIMGPGSRISHLNVCKGLDRIEMAENTSIGRLNWITGFPAPSKPGQHFHHQTDRRSELVLGPNSGITNRHFVDCTNSITLGDFSNVGGFRCQLMTHTVDIVAGRQSSAPISIGPYSLVSTACVMLGGSSLPAYSVLSACSLANKPLSETHTLYGGVPARALKRLPPDAGYFVRKTAYII